MNPLSEPNIYQPIGWFSSLRTKLMILLFSLSLIPAILIAVLTYHQAKKSLEDKIFSQLADVRDFKAEKIMNYFAERQVDINMLSNNLATVEAMRSFIAAMTDTDEPTALNQIRSHYLNKPTLNDVKDKGTYSTAHAKYHPMFKQYLTHYGYHDIFLVAAETGHILYTVMKEDDYGTNLLYGPYAKSVPGNIFQAVINLSSRRHSVLIKDFEYYTPSNERGLFLATPILEQSKLIGVLICQLAVEQIDALIQSNVGLGKTSETLLIGADDFLLRSHSQFFQTTYMRIEDEASRAAVAGNTGISWVNMETTPSLVAYRPLDIAGIKWLLYTKIDQAEAFAMTDSLFRLVSIVIGLMMIIIAIIVFFLSQWFIEPIASVNRFVRQLSQGNLKQTIALDANLSPIAQDFQQLLINLRQIVADMVQIAQGLAKGELDVRPQAAYPGDFMPMKIALETGLEKIASVNQDLTQVSQGLVAGNLSVTPQINYPGNFIPIKTALVSNLANLKQLIHDIIQVSQGLMDGNQLTTQIDYQGDFAQIKQALDKAANHLLVLNRQNQVQSWLKSGQAQLNAQLSGEQSIDRLTQKMIAFMTTYVEAQVGLLYLMKTPTNKENYLQLVASYAYIKNSRVPDSYLLGKGLVGEAALTRQVIAVGEAVHDKGIISRSGLAGSLPKQVLILPFLYENQVKGVIEIGSSSVINDEKRDFLQQMMPNMGVVINTAESRYQTQHLLEKSQQQTEDLQAKQAQLSVNNEKLLIQSQELENQQAELRQTNESLEERTQDLEKQKTAVQAKNLALEQTKLEMQTAQAAIETKAKELALASQYKSEFLANMSHELRTPLNSLLILAQLLADNRPGNLDKNQVKYAQTIHSAGNDLLTLINEILDLSKVEAGKIEVQLEAVVLLDLIGSIEQKFQPIADDKGLLLECQMADNLPASIQSDGQRLKQVLNNLLSNAFKFTSKGVVKVLIERPNQLPDLLGNTQLKDASTLSIRVIDSGIGIPQDKQGLIFEAFQQADGSTSRRYGGTGLGLSISRQLARLLGGDLTLDSEENKGSCFTLYLPEQLSPGTMESEDTLSDKPIDTKNQTLETDKPAKIEMTHNKSGLLTDKKILVVDDDRRNIFALLTILEESKMKVIVASDGKEALDKLAENSDIALVLMDIMMPEMDGYEAMQAIRQQPQYANLPIIALTAKAMKEDKTKCIEAGANDYIAKPVESNQLIALIRLWLYR